MRRHQIAGGDDAELTVLRIARPGEELNREAEERACGHLVSEVLGSCDSPVRTKVVVHDVVVERASWRKREKEATTAGHRRVQRMGRQEPSGRSGARRYRRSGALIGADGAPL